MPHNGQACFDNFDGTAWDEQGDTTSACCGPSNAVALDAQGWVLRLPPSDRQLPVESRSWEQERVVAYVAQYTKEMAQSAEVIKMLTAADHGLAQPPPPPPGASDAKRPRCA